MSWMAEVLERGRWRWPDRTALLDRERSLTYAELDRRTDALAAGLLGAGLRRGDRVGVLSRGRLEVLETYFALGKLGAAFVPVNYAAVPAETGAMLGRCGVELVIGERDLLDRAGEALPGRTLAFEDDRYAEWTTGRPCDLPPVDETDVLTILHTSATTGAPKGVVIDHRSLRSMAIGYLAVARPEDDVVWLNGCPLFHGALVQPIIMMAAGATVVVVPSFTPQGCLAELQRTRATHLWLVPPMLRFLLQARGLATADLSALREIVYSAAPMPAELLAQAWERLGCRFRQIYGMTEGGGPMAMAGPEDHRLAPGEPPPARLPVGRPIPGMRMSVRDDEGRALPPGEVGEVCVRGDGLMQRYLDDPEATRDAIRDGWLHTGDLGHMDDRGFITLVGRSKDLINRGGQKVFPAEVENVLAEHPGVADVVVLGVGDQQWGEVPVACVVPGQHPVQAADLVALMRGRLSSYKVPVRIEFVTEIPRTPAGKILRRVLRERFDEPA
ncbi:MAG TPA: AMP-binding protein [Candidatus Dormibacteraeota bacterium]